DSYLVFVAPERYIRPNSDALCVWRDEALFLGRNIDTEGGSRALIKSWLDLCCKSHRGPCTDIRNVERQSKFGHMISQSYFGVIDIYNMRLTSLPYQVSGELVTYDPYVALSHVWGEQRSCMTTLDNIMLHRSHGGLERTLASLPTPHAFRDAIDVVRGLGIQYLWIDSLCIIQDSTRSWNLNSRVMDLIYWHAKLTICAADGNDSSAGLRAMHAREHEHHQYMKECVTGVRLMVSRPPELGIKASTWDTRAWTFQERLLSPRSLIYTEGRVYFQCLSTGMSEDIFADKQGAGWSLDLVQAPLQMLSDLARRAPWVYVNFVSLYTSRNLTKPRDILAAFNGVSNVMRKKLGAPFIFGLPSSHFDLALLWEPEKALKRRRPGKNDEKEKAEFNGMEFPSWSWCGWWGSKMEYNSGMVEGCLMDLNEWLIKHTWIHWYIRDGHGNLRPLWDGALSEDVTLEKRWMGYGGKSEDDEVELRKQVIEVPAPARRKRRGRKRRGRKRRGRKRSARSPSSSSSSSSSFSSSSSSAEDDADDSHRDHGQRFTRIEPSERRDPYGRDIPMEIADHQDDFRQTLPESPYRVVMTEYSSESDKEFPDQPILQFWTWHTALHIAPSDDDDDPSPPGRNGSGLRRYDIADQVGDWCGSLVLDEQWTQASKSSRHEFIAISDAKAFTRDECDVWTYYTPKEREQSEWDLYFVLLVERKGVKWERVALGKVFKAAFAMSEWKEIILG
ncbi:heterokaryon incompatibility protein-domain-containing protein, partial [Usnea florida]